MKLLNINDEAPDIFYIFIGNGNRLPNQINYHNYKLGAPLMSGGFKNLMAMPEKINDFVNGNILYAPFVPNKMTFPSPTSHLLYTVNGYNVEYILEYTRDLKFKNFPSRFSCLYAFGDYESCVKAHEYYDWDLSEVKKFKLKSMGKPLDMCVKVAKCNMEIVTRMWNCDIISFDRNSIDKIASAYWCGISNVATERQDLETGNNVITPARVLYEYLIEGVLEEIKE